MVELLSWGYTVFHTASYNAPKMKGNKCVIARENETRSSLRNDAQIADE